MKKSFLLAVAVAFVFMFASPALAGDMPAPVEKLGHGFMDVVTSPMELYHVPKTEIDTSDHAVLGFFKGLVKSPFYVVKKAGGGLIDIVTFPID